MNFTQYQSYALPAVVILFLLFRFLSFRRALRVVPKLLAEGATVIDVRSRAEFQSGANPNSVNIPLDELEKKTSSFDRMKPLILCCASGTRSAMAAAKLKKMGFQKVLNAGPWSNTIIK